MSVLFYRSFFFILLFTFVWSAGKAQKNNWVNFFGDSTDTHVSASVKQVSNSLYHLGRTDSGSFSSIQLTKHSLAGKLIWTKTFNKGNYCSSEYLNVTTDQNLIFCGQTPDSVNQTSDIILIKADTNGNLIWRRQFDYNHSNQNLEYIEETADHGFIATGFTNQDNGNANDFYVVKFDSLGAKEWEKLIGTERNEVAHCIHQLKNGGYVVSGDKQQDFSSGYQMYLVRLDLNGDKVWDLVVPDSNNTGNQLFIIDKNENYVLVGEGSTDNNIYFDIALAKINLDGELIWYKKSGKQFADAGCSILEKNTGELIVTGYSASNPNSAYDNVFLAKFDTNGVCEGTKYFPTPFIAIGYDLTATSNSRFCIAASGNGKFCLIHTFDDSYSTSFSETYNRTLSISKSRQDNYRLFPNPADRSFSIWINQPLRVTISDIKGKVLFSKSYSNIGSENIDTSEFKNGIYFLSIDSEGVLNTEKLVIVH